jgi:hypothetical protein
MEFHRDWSSQQVNIKSIKLSGVDLKNDLRILQEADGSKRIRCVRDGLTVILVESRVYIDPYVLRNRCEFRMNEERQGISILDKFHMAGSDRRSISLRK